MAEELKIIVGADVTEAQAGLSTVGQALDDMARKGQLSIGVLERSMQDLKNIIRTTTDPGDLQKLNTAFQQMNDRLTQLKAQGGLEDRLGGISRASRIAHVDIEEMGRSLALFASGSTNALQSLGNVAFNFERLAGQTGGTAEAFAELGGSLLGPIGIITGVSILSPLLQKLIGDLSGTEEAAKASKASFEALQTALKSIGETMTELKGELDFSNQLAALNAQINNLPKVLNLEGVSVAQAQFTQTLTEQRDILTKLRDNFSLIDFTDTSENITKQLHSLSASIISSIKDLNTEIDHSTGDQRTSLVSLRNSLEVLNTQLLTSDKLSADQRIQIQKDFNSQVDKLNQDTNKSAQTQSLIYAQISEQNVETARKSADAQLGVAQQQLDNMKQIVQLAQQAQKDLVSQGFVIPKEDIISDETLKTFSEAGQKLIAEKQRLQEELKKINLLEAMGLDETQAKASIQLQITGIDKQVLQDQFNQSVKFLQDLAAGPLKRITIPIDLVLPKAEQVSDLAIKVPVLISEASKADIKKSIEDLLTKIQAKLPLDLQPNFTKDVADLQKKLDEALNSGNFNEVLKIGVKLGIDEDAAGLARGTLNGISKDAAFAATTINESLTPAITGMINAFIDGKNPAKAFFDGLIRSLEQIIDKLIAAAIEAAILSETFSSTKVSQAGGFSGIFNNILGIGGGATQSAQAGAAAAGLTAVSTTSTAAAAGLGTMTGAAAAATAALAALATSAAFGSAGQAAGLLGSLLGAFPFFAEGGDPPVGLASIVGEKGPELFIPKVPGHIYTHEQTKEIISRWNSEEKLLVRESETFRDFIKTHSDFRNDLRDSVSSFEKIFERAEEVFSKIEVKEITSKLNSEERLFNSESFGNFLKDHSDLRSDLRNSALSFLKISERVEQIFPKVNAIAFAPTLSIMNEGFGSVSTIEKIQNTSSSKQITMGEMNFNHSFDPLELMMDNLVLAIARHNKSQGRTSG